MNKKSLLIVISGPSGVGKGTVIKKLLSDNPDIIPSISVTTRKPRDIDVEGVTYFFRSREQFKDMIDNGELLEWAVYNGNYYGTPRKYVSDSLNDGKDVLLEIDVQGALNLMENYPSAVYIFIAPENTQVLKERLEKRSTESPEEIQRRVEAADWELSKKDLYDNIVINRVVDDAADEILSILNKRRNSL
ncbi:MAG TPA: guanylate kinase [Candidatus Monoglobus merdigallinarum]|uniref:Guanylate kinase n=1 Tax=Candidatus Monoglobus merdigallinarum TaxID=2838698 RepID=A0A9D1PS22_9FIRM|nr:guanylate kinase [Candidatus Monoglobus merdigallinarum]